MKIFLGADHNGFELKEHIESYLRKLGHEVVDCGDDQLNPSDDFTVYASRVIHAMRADGMDKAKGILICGSGQGMVIAANRFKGIRAGLGWSVGAARSIRNDEDSNVLAIPAELFKSDTTWKKVVDTWLLTPFANAHRYKRRNAQLDDLV